MPAVQDDADEGRRAASPAASRGAQLWNVARERAQLTQLPTVRGGTVRSPHVLCVRHGVSNARRDFASPPACCEARLGPRVLVKVLLPF